jgi:hypothetical protein
VDDKVNTISNDGKAMNKSALLTAVVVLIMVVSAAISTYYLLTLKRLSYTRGWLTGQIPAYNMDESGYNSTSTDLPTLAGKVDWLSGDLESNTFMTRNQKFQKFRIVQIKDRSVAGVVLQTYLDGDELIFNFLEVLRITIFHALFRFVIKKLILLQNLKYKKDHEKQLVSWLSLFQLVNSSMVVVYMFSESRFFGANQQVVADRPPLLVS